MEGTWDTIRSIPASGTKTIGDVIELVRARTLSITTRIDFGGSIDADATVNVYYSPDGNNWDSIAYASHTITYSAGNTVQRTVIIDPPEHGYIQVKITNGSSADTLDNIRTWYSIQSWLHYREASRGDISTKTMGD